jgi:L-ascorbate metabolism protein UlaG (beta-lactamase superfamily)
MNITWYGHSCFKLETGGSALLIDPFLKGNPTFEKSGVAFADAIKGVTHVALTHGHGDHVGDAGEICKTNGATLLAVFELAMFLKGKGADKLEPMGAGGTVRTADFDLSLTNAVHSSSSDTGVYLGNACGLVIKPKAAADAKHVVYHMGDTDMFAGMELIAAFHQPTVGIVPIGDRFTMGAKAAAFACRRFFTFSTIIPCHYGTFAGMLDSNPEAFTAEMRGHHVAAPKVGVPLPLG